MIVTLTQGETIYEIANGQDRVSRVVERPSFALTQKTQTTTRARAAWVTGFPDRAARSIARSFEVGFPECDSIEAAELQAVLIPVQCPRGGVLTELHGSTLITYENAWIEGGILVEPFGRRNFFTFNFTATNPSTATLSLLAQMDSRYKANLNVAPFSLTGLTGGTAGKLDALATTDVDLGFKGELFFLLGSIYVTKTFQLVTLATAVTVTGGDGSENTDPAAGSLIIHPDDRDAEDNDKVWLEVL